MRDNKTGVPFDRILMRIKDAIIITGALIAGFKEFYLKPLQMQGKIDQMTAQMEQLSRVINANK